MKFFFLWMNALVLLPTYAYSATWIATGHITQVEYGLNTNIQVNDSFALRIDFDDTAIDQSDRTDRGIYSGEWVILDIGDFHAQNLGPVNYGPDIIVSDNWDGSGWDELTINSGLKSHLAPLQGDRELVSIVAQLRDNQGSVLSSDSLPTTLSNLSLFESASLELLFSNDYTSDVVAFDAKWVYGEITSLTAIPIPASVYLFISGLLVLFSFRRNQ